MSAHNRNTRLKNKVVWITGASSGIGEALSYELARLGARLILSARNANNLKRVHQNIRDLGAQSSILILDLEEHDILNSKAAEAISIYGHIDYLINNAGVAVRDFVHSTDISIDKKLMDINYFGPIVLSKALLPHFTERKSGHYVIISSLSGKYGVPRVASYAASKHALHGFFETLRSETVDLGIYITIVVPGIIQTNITAHAVKGDGQKTGRVEETFKKAYPVEKAAKKIVAATISRKEEVFVGGFEGITLLMNRISPWLLRRFIRNHPIKRLRNIKKFFSLNR